MKPSPLPRSTTFVHTVTSLITVFTLLACPFLCRLSGSVVAETKAPKRAACCQRCAQPPVESDERSTPTDDEPESGGCCACRGAVAERHDLDLDPVAAADALPDLIAAVVRNSDRSAASLETLPPENSRCSGYRARIALCTFLC